MVLRLKVTAEPGHRYQGLRDQAFIAGAKLGQGVGMTHGQFSGSASCCWKARA